MIITSSPNKTTEIITIILISFTGVDDANDTGVGTNDAEVDNVDDVKIDDADDAKVDDADVDGADVKVDSTNGEDDDI